MANPCTFSHRARSVNLTVHGDDFFAEALPALTLIGFESGLMKKFEGKFHGTPAAERRRDEVAQPRGARSGYEWEADQRHAELIATGVGLLPDSKSLTTPGRKLTAKEWEK